MKSIFMTAILLVVCTVQMGYGLAKADHRRDGPIPYPIRVNSESTSPLMDSGSSGLTASNVRTGPYDAMDYLRPLFRDSGPFQHRNHALPSQETTFHFPGPSSDRPLDGQQHRFVFADRDAPMEFDRQTPPDFILTAMRSSQRNPLQVVSLLPTKGDSPEARLDTNAPVFTVLAHPNRQPDNMRDYAFLEDTEDHLKSTAPTPQTPITTHSNAKTTRNFLTTPKSRLSPTLTTKTQPTTRQAAASPTLATTILRPSTSTRSTPKTSQITQNKTTTLERTPTVNTSIKSELRMAPNSAFDKHHERKRSPQQELPYTPSFRRRNNMNSNTATRNIQNYNNGNYINSNPLPSGGQFNPTTPNNAGYGNNNLYNYGSFKNPNPTHNSGYANNPNSGYINQQPVTSGNYNNPNFNNGGYNNNPNFNNAGISNNNFNNAGFINPNLNNAGFINPNLNNGGYVNPNIANNYPNNYYNTNQNVPYGITGTLTNPQIPLAHNYPINPNNYNLVTLYTPQLPVGYRAQQPIAVNTLPALPPLTYPIQLTPMQNIQSGILPGYLANPPPFGGLGVSMVNPPAVVPTAGLIATPPILATGGLNLVNPYIGLYSQPLVSAVPSPMILTHTPYVEPAQALPTPSPVYRNTYYVPPDMYADSQRPHSNDNDDNDDDNGYTDDDNHNEVYNNQQGSNIFPPVYFPNAGYQPSGSGGGDAPMPSFYHNDNHNNNANPQQNIPTRPNQGSNTNVNMGNTGTPGLVSDSFPEFQSSGSFSPSKEPTYDADFVNRPKKVNRNRGNSGTRNNGEEVTNFRQSSATGFGTKINQQIPRVEPAEGRSTSSLNGGSKLLLPQHFTETDSTTSKMTTKAPLLNITIKTTEAPILNITIKTTEKPFLNFTTMTTTESLMSNITTTMTETPILNTTTETITTTITIKNVTLDDDDDDYDDVGTHINITITEPTTTPQMASDRASSSFQRHEQLLRSNLFVSLPIRPTQMSPISVGHSTVQGYSINDPYLRHFIRESGPSIPIPLMSSDNENARKEGSRDTHLCTDLFGLKIPGCKISRMKVRTSTTPSTTKPKTKKSKSKPKIKSFNPQLFDIVEGGSFTEPKLPVAIQTTHSYIRPPPYTIPISQIEHLLLGDGTQQQGRKMSFIGSPPIMPIRLQSLPLQPNGGRSMTYDRRSRLIAQGHPAFFRSRF